MRQYELAIRIAQVHHLVDERKYKKALAVIQTLDMRQVRTLSDLKVFAEVYTKTEQYEAAKATYLRIYRRSHTKRVLYRLIYLSIRTNALNDAEAYYQEFVRMNPNARDALILRYRIDKASGAPIGQLIEILQELKQEEYIEEWAYELAKLYHRAGRREECKEECEDILLWFGTGEIVERAKILIEHLEEPEPIPYYDDKDFTVSKKEEPNPEDTGSLPDLHEFIKERKAHKREERREAKRVREEQHEESVLQRDSKEEQKKSEPSIEGQAKQKKVESEALPTDDFVDDYEDGDFDEEGMDISQKAKDGIQKISGLLKIGRKEEDSDVQSKQEEKTAGEEKPSKEDQIKIGFVPHSQSGMGITQDLAKEIAAIYEMEHREQLKEKAVTVIQDTSNIATNVVERMTQAIQKNAGKSYIPLDIEEIQPEKPQFEETQAEENFIQDKVVEDDREEPVLDKVELVDEKEEDIIQKEMTAEEPEDTIQSDAKETDIQELEAEEELPTSKAFSEEELRERALTKMLEEEVAEIQKGLDEEEIVAAKRKDTERLKSLLEEEIEDPKLEQQAVFDSPLMSPEMKTVEPREHLAAEEDTQPLEPVEELVAEEVSVSQEEELLVEDTKDLTQEQEMVQEHVFGLEGYQAPDIPVVETEYMEMPEITYEELPTTRALQQSFKNVLKLIAGELDPSHFVLMGDGSERIVGVSKQIVRVMKEAGYLSQGRIAKIHATQINQMDLISFRSQLKGNCLLIEGASDLLFPTITRLFSIMEEYYGDFVVILVDEGTTLDQLFRFVPALARKFKYIIDISNYTPEDYL